MSNATFLHTSDWHLGRTLNGTSLLLDQRQALDKLVAAARELRPTAVLIAGDIFDRALPPAEAVELLDDVLDELVRKLELTVILIAGNHDSPERIGYAKGLLARQNLHVRGVLDDAALQPIRLEHEHGAIDIAPIPFADPATVRDRLKLEGPLDTDAAMRALLGRAWSNCSATRRIAMVHTYVAGSSTTESERPLSIGALDQVRADAFAGWHYTALGHLHRPQQVGGGAIRYCGSLFGYSGSEVDHDKSATLITLDPAGTATWREIALVGERRLRSVTGKLADLARCGGVWQKAQKQDFVYVTLTDETPQMDAMAQLRQAWPNAVTVEAAKSLASGGVKAATLENGRSLPLDEVVQKFWAHSRPEIPMPERELQLLHLAMKQVAGDGQ